MYEYKAKVLNIVDGDTFDLDVDLGFSIHHYIRVRLLDIDTPEKRSLNPEEKENGQICAYLAEYFWLNKEVVIKSYKDIDINTDSFGRYLVYIKDSNINAVDLYNQYCMNKLNKNYNPSIFKTFYNQILGSNK